MPGILNTLLNREYQGVDHELRRACENVISYCVGYVCHPITTWTDLARQQQHTSFASKSNTVITTAMTEAWANPSAAEGLDKAFREACERDLRSNINQIRLYLEDERTVNVLVTHALERITEEYAVFRNVASSLHARGMLMSTAELGHVLQDTCGLVGGS